jgi:DNA repair protein RadC
MEEYCHLKEYFVCEGYCYSNEWLERLASEFKERVIFSIFFKKAEPKKDKRKGGKKEKSDALTEEELQEILFNCGFAEYSVAETLAPELLPLITDKIEEMRKKVEKELAQNKGFINNTFLKYRSGKTVLRTEESLTRMVNIIQKQQKKEKWPDP